MSIEFEAKFSPVEIEDARKRLAKAGAKLVRPDFEQKRFVFTLPGSTSERRQFVRVRDEGDKITLTLKVFSGTKIDDQQEYEVNVSDFDTAVSILKAINLTPAAYEESRREKWSLGSADVTIDTWPFLGTIIEVEGTSESEVKVASEKLGFTWSKAQFCSVGTLYVEKYGMGPADLAKKTGKMTNLTFNGPNPFN